MDLFMRISNPGNVCIIHIIWQRSLLNISEKQRFSPKKGRFSPKNFVLRIYGFSLKSERRRRKGSK